MDPLQGEVTTIAVLAAAVLFALKTILELVRGRALHKGISSEQNMLSVIQQQAALLAQITATQTIITSSLQRITNTLDEIIRSQHEAAVIHEQLLGRTSMILDRSKQS